MRRIEVELERLIGCDFRCVDGLVLRPALLDEACEVDLIAEGEIDPNVLPAVQIAMDH